MLKSENCSEKSFYFCWNWPLDINKNKIYSINKYIYENIMPVLSTNTNKMKQILILLFTSVLFLLWQVKMSAVKKGLLMGVHHTVIRFVCITTSFYFHDMNIWILWWLFSLFLMIISLWDTIMFILDVLSILSNHSVFIPFTYPSDLWLNKYNLSPFSV